MDGNDAYVRPKAAWNKLRTARADGVDVYIFGATGYGKTELISRLLRRQNTVTFTAWNLTADDLVPEALPLGNTVVIDDLQWAERDDVRQAILALLRRTDIWVVMAGRSPMPEWLMPAFHERLLEVITEEDLALTAENIKELFHQMEAYPSDEVLAQLLPALSGSPKAVRMVAQALSTGELYSQAMYNRLMERYWLYLDQYVYCTWPEGTQEFMLQLCVMDSFTLPIAIGVTGRKDAETLLRRVQEIGNLFVGSPEGYTMRWQLLQGLRSRINRTWTAEERQALYLRIGRVYEQEGMLPQALDFYDRANHSDAIAQLLIKNASRNIGVGFHYEMRRYYFRLPEETILQHPALMAAMSMLTSLVLNLQESDRWYQELKRYAANHPEADRRQIDGWIAYLEIALPHRGADDVLPTLRSIAGSVLNGTVILPEFSITSGQPSIINGSKDFSTWCRRDGEIATTYGQPTSIVLGRYGKGLIDIAVAESQFERGRHWEAILSLANSGLMAAQAGGKQELQFVAVAILARVYCMQGMAADARSMMDQYGKELEGHRRIRCNLEALQARLDLYLGHPEAAAKWLYTLPPDGTSFDALDRYRYVTKVRLLIIQDQIEAALTLLTRLKWYADMTRRPYLQIECLLLGAIIRHRQGDEHWKKSLGAALRQAEKLDLVRLLSREGAALMPMLREWPEEKRTPFFQRVLKETENMARKYPHYLNHAQLDGPELDEQSMRLLRLLADGCSRKKIAELTGLPERTVKYRTERIYHTLDAAGKMEAVEKARKMGVL